MRNEDQLPVKNYSQVFELIFGKNGVAIKLECRVIMLSFFFFFFLSWQKCIHLVYLWRN